MPVHVRNCPNETTFRKSLKPVIRKPDLLSSVLHLIISVCSIGQSASSLKIVLLYIYKISFRSTD